MSEAKLNGVLEATTAAVRRLLRPLASAMIQAGLTFPTFNALTREIFVDAALEDFTIDGKSPSHSRIAILSGVHRQEIRRLAMRDKTMSGPPPTVPLGAKVIAVWTSMADYLDADRQPLALPRTAADDQPSFDRLVTSVSKDVRPRALLDEWLRQEVVALQDGQVHLRRAAYLPADGYDEKAYFFGRNLRDHIAAGAHNLAGNQPAFFDRAVYYDRLRQDSVDELHQLAADKGMELLIEINRKASELAARDRKAGDGGYRFTLGAYFYGEPTEGSTEADRPMDRSNIQSKVDDKP